MDNTSANVAPPLNITIVILNLHGKLMKIHGNDYRNMATKQFKELAFNRHNYVCARALPRGGERHLGCKYSYCLFLNTRVHVVWWLAPNF
jgi:hypothetical protein